ncbi:MAG: hypothetical protein HY289_05400 [Planctomycetes bacterium]|nr:hypothetical protein [Planctomycetota bacterium]
MSPNGQAGYELRHLPIVVDQIKFLAEQAAVRGMQPQLGAALKTVLEKLRKEPSTWGDPDYNLKKPGGCVYHGIVEPVIVTYAVFEREKIVLITKVRWLPDPEDD